MLMELSFVKYKPNTKFFLKKISPIAEMTADRRKLIAKSQK